MRASAHPAGRLTNIAPPGAHSNATQTPQDIREAPIPYAHCPGTSSMTGRFAKVALGAAIALSTLLLAACSRAPKDSLPAYQYTSMLSASNHAAAPAPRRILSFDQAQAAPAATQPKLAVTHAFDLSMPADQVEAVQRRDLDECQRLGCTVLTTRLQHGGQNTVFAHT